MLKRILTFLLLTGYGLSPAQISRQWVATFNGQGDFNDRYTCIIKDNEGNYFLGGSTVNPGNDRDFLLRKLSPNGAVIWELTLDGEGDAADEVTAIKIAPGGFLAVTGISKGSDTSEDFWTMSIKPSGDTLWTRRFDGVGEYDQPAAIDVDASGNIAVSGFSDGNPNSGENDDYLTLRYNSAGNILWAKRYNGLGNGIDRAVGVVANNAGQVFVTGRSDNGINDDYVTICYDAAGNQQWIRYDDRGDRDRAAAMTKDGAGNILITGLSSNGDNEDFWTLKYNAAGTALWQKAYDFVDDDRALAICTDPSGNVYVTGQSDQAFTAARNWDIATVAFSANGAPLWAARYDSPISQDEFPTAIVADSDGRVFVTGRGDADAGLGIDHEIVTIGYLASNGNQLWQTNFSGLPNRDNAGNGIVHDGNGGCLVAGYKEDETAFRNAFLLHYSATGNELWQAEFSGTGDNTDVVRHVAVDGQNNVSIAGYTISNGDNRNLMFARFTPQGDFDCRYVENGSAASAVDDAQALALDAAGNPVVMGYVKNSGQSNDIFLSKFNATCDTLWARNINGNANGSERAYSMTQDGQGNLYLTGRSDQLPGPLSNDACYTLKIHENTGLIDWVRKYDADTIGAERGIIVKTKGANQVYVAGKAFNGIDDDLFLLQYDGDGNLLWSKTWAAANGHQEPVDMGISGTGDIYVLANTAVSGDSIRDVALLKYDAAGNLIWTKIYGNTALGDDAAVAMAIDPTGEVVIAAKSDLAPGSQQIYGITLLKYNAEGQLLWQVTPPGTGTADQIPDALTIGPGRKIYLAAHHNDGSAAIPDNNIAVFILNPAGQVLWHDGFDGGYPGGSDIPNTIVVNGSDFYIGGSTYQGPVRQRDMLLIKYSGNLSAVQSPDETAIRLYPNPATTQIQVEGWMADENAALTLYDPTGRRIQTCPIQPDGACFLTGTQPGIYLYRIFSGNQIIHTGKLAVH